MGPDQLNQQIKTLQARARRYRQISELFGDAEVSAKLTQLARELDDAIQKLEYASKLIGATVEESHRLWAGVSFDFVIAKLRAREAASPDHLTSAKDWRAVARLWIEEAESSTNHPDKELLAARAFEIAQLAEALARAAESREE